MGIAKVYNSATSQWEPLIVAAGSGGGGLGSASVATVTLTGGPITVRASSDPLVDPENGIYGESFGWNYGYDADVWTWSDPDGIFEPVTALTNWCGHFTSSGSYMIQTVIDSPSLTEPTDYGYYQIGVWSIDPLVGGPIVASTGVLTLQGGIALGATTFGTVTTEYITSPNYTEIYQEFGYVPATVGSYATINNWTTYVYFWPD